MFLLCVPHVLKHCPQFPSRSCSHHCMEAHGTPKVTCEEWCTALAAAIKALRWHVQCYLFTWIIFFARLCKACLHGTIDCQSRILQCTVMPPAVSWDITVCLLQACRCSYLWPVTGDQLLVTNYLWPVTCGTGYLWDLLLVRPVTCDQLLVEACLHTHSEFLTALQSFWFCQIWV